MAADAVGTDQDETLIDYTSKVKNYIIKPLGDMHMGDVTADDIRLALLSASKKSASFWGIPPTFFFR